MFGRVKVERVLGSLSRAVTAAGVLEVIMVLSGGRDNLASLVRAGRTWSGSLVEVRRSRSEK